MDWLQDSTRGWLLGIRVSEDIESDEQTIVYEDGSVETSQLTDDWATE